MLLLSKKLKNEILFYVIIFFTIKSFFFLQYITKVTQLVQSEQNKELKVWTSKQEGKVNKFASFGSCVEPWKVLNSGDNSVSCKIFSLK